MSAYLKAPAALLDYAIDWAAGYLGSETITTSSWAVSPIEVGGLAITGQSQASGRAAVVLSGGVPGHIYTVENSVSFSDGRTDVRGITVRIDVR